MYFRMSEVEVNSGGAQTVDRALAVLKCIVSEGRPILLEDLSQRVGLSSSVVYRLVRSLVAAGFIRRDPEMSGYCVAADLISMAVQISGRIDLRRIARPAMQAIGNEFGETVSLHVRTGEQRVCVEVVDGIHVIRRVVPIGETVPIYLGETGRIFLSALSDDERKPFVALAAAAGVDTARLQRDIALARKKGFFIGVGERTPNVGSISVALPGPDALMGVITVSGPDFRWNRSSMEAAAPRILELIRPISQGFKTGEPT
jgi:DNA-binding IclR family transcriptional regulator